MSATLAHLAWWDRVATKRLDDLIRLRTPPRYIDDAVNDEMLPQWRAVPGSEAAREVLAAAEAVDERIATAPDDVFTDIQREWPRVVDRSLHRNEHLADIERSVLQLGRGT